jgi:preprotein translocase subunit SecE
MAKKEKSQAAEKIAKAEKASKVKKPKSDKGNVFARIGNSIAKFVKDFKSELKKIVWPERKTVLKSTGVVLTVVAVIGVIIFLIDTGLTQVIQLLSKAATDFHDQATTAVAAATEAITEAVTEVATTIGG